MNTPMKTKTYLVELTEEDINDITFALQLSFGRTTDLSKKLKQSLSEHQEPQSS